MRRRPAFVFAMTAGILGLAARAPQSHATWTSGLIFMGPAGILHAQLKDPPLVLPGETPQTTKEHREVEFIDPRQTAIPAHRSSTIELHFRVADELHINSHAPGDKTLIPTRLAVVEEPGINVTAVDFPPGAVYTPPFAPQEKLSVYAGAFTLRAHMIVQPGEHLLHAALRYQACDVNSCMPPRTLPIEVGISAK